jgi:hypothetical protein
MYLWTIVIVLIEKGFTVLEHLVDFVGRGLVSWACAAWNVAECGLLGEIFIVIVELLVSVGVLLLFLFLKFLLVGGI